MSRCQRIAAWLAAPLALLTVLPAGAQRAQSHASSGFTPIWQRSLPPVIALAISPQGGYVAMITQGGKLVEWSGDDGSSLWSQTGVGVHNVAVSDQMGYVLAYDAMNRINRTVKLYRGRAGSTAGALAAGTAAPPPSAPRHPLLAMSRALDGAIWCSTVSLDGSRAAIGGGDRKVTVVQLDPHPKFATYPVDGVCNSLEFAGNDQYLAVGLWNQSGVETLDNNGRIRWSYLAANNRRYEVSVSPDSRKVLAISYLNHDQSDPVLNLLDDQGGIRWTYRLGPGAYQPTATLAPATEASYASYTQTVRRGREAIPERNLVALSPLGDVLWSKGGLFFSPRLICLTPDHAGAVAYDGARTLYRLSGDGNIVARDKLSGELQSWACSRDSRRLLLYTSDGQLSMVGLQ